MNDANSKDFVVKRSNLSDVRWAPAQTRTDHALEPGEALLKVDRYAFTANNITYALAGEVLRYWEFFPAEAGWGRIPVWGHADVVSSRAAGLPSGQRVYGYLPMSPLLKVQPAQVTASTFLDHSPHRSHLPAIYQGYTRTQREDSQHEDLRALLQPLFATGWLIDDWLLEHGQFGAQQLLFGSASSKTALATAFMLSRRAGRSFELIALTSPRHRAFCERTTYYDRVLDYADIASLSAQTPTAFIDMSGSLAVRRSVHEHFGAALRWSSAVGLAHGKLSAPEPLPGPAPQQFSAPAQAAKYQSDLAAFGARLDGAQSAFFASAPRWLELVAVRGPAAIEAMYRRALTGELEPHQGVIMSL